MISGGLIKFFVKKSTSKILANKIRILKGMDANHPPVKTYPQIMDYLSKLLEVACNPVPKGHSCWTLCGLCAFLKLIK